MSVQEKEIRFEGIVRARQGIAFYTAIECTDGTEWVIDYGSWAPYHAFADRRVLVSGEPGHCRAPSLQRRLFRVGQKGGEFRVLIMRLAEVTPDAEIIEIGAPQRLSGKFERRTSNSGDATQLFVTEKGDTFLVANDPPGTSVGCYLDVRAYPVHLAPSISRPHEKYLWIYLPTFRDREILREEEGKIDKGAS
jgi:hypothetical protein